MNGADEAAPRARKRICIVSDECVGPWRNGGIGAAMSGLAAALAQAGHDVTLLYTRGFLLAKREVEQWRAHYAQYGIRLECLRPGDLARADGPLAAIDIVAPSAVLDFLTRSDFDIVHCNDTNGDGFLAIAAHRSRLLSPRTRFVVALHSPRRWIAELNRHMLNIPANVALDAAERLSIAGADTVWAPSRYMLGWIKSRGYAPPADARLMQYVIPPSDFLAAAETPPQAAAPSASIASIVFFGRLEKRKGLDLFLAAIDRLGDLLAQKRIEIVFLGKAGDLDGVAADEAIASRAARWRFPWRILSALGRREALDFLRQGGRLAVMAAPADNSPCTIYEALEFGLPFLAAEAGGVPELIHPEDRADILFPFDTQALSDRLERALADGVRPARLAQPREERLKRWLDFHDEDFAPAKRQPPAPAALDIVIEAGTDAALLRRTLASLPSMDRPPLIIGERTGAESTDRGEPAARGAARAALQRRMRETADNAVLFVHAGVTLLPEALDRLSLAMADGGDGMAPSVATGRGRRADALAASLAMAFLQGPAPTGLMILSRATLEKALAEAFAPDAGPFSGICDAALLAGADVRPFPFVCAQISREALRRLAPEATHGRLELYARAEGQTLADLALLATHATGREARRNLMRRWGFRAYRSPLGPFLPELIFWARNAAGAARRAAKRIRA